MAKLYPDSVGEWVHMTIRLVLIATGIALLSMAFYTAILAQDTILGILISGVSTLLEDKYKHIIVSMANQQRWQVLLSIAGDVGAISIYRRKSMSFPCVILADILACILCSIGAAVGLLSSLANNDGLIPQEEEPERQKLLDVDNATNMLAFTMV